MFRKSNPTFDIIHAKAWNLARENAKKATKSNKEFSSSLPSSTNIPIYTDASWVDSSSNSGLGFIIISNQKFSLSKIHRFPLRFCKDEIAALTFALKHCCSRQWIPNRIMTDCAILFKTLKIVWLGDSITK